MHREGEMQVIAWVKLCRAFGKRWEKERETSDPVAKDRHRGLERHSFDNWKYIKFCPPAHKFLFPHSISIWATLPGGCCLSHKVSYISFKGPPCNFMMFSHHVVATLCTCTCVYRRKILRQIVVVVGEKIKSSIQLSRFFFENVFKPFFFFLLLNWFKVKM